MPTALQWLYSAIPMECPLILGDVVIAGNGDPTTDPRGDVPASLVHLIFGPHRFVVQTKTYPELGWRDTHARFDDYFDATIWCLLFSLSLRPGPQFRVAEDPVAPELVSEPLFGGE